jgi:hypothetical protein
MNATEHPCCVPWKKAAQSQFPLFTLFLLFASLAPDSRVDKYANTNEADL